jgi:hypothetical protein
MWCDKSTKAMIVLRWAAERASLKGPVVLQGGLAVRCCSRAPFACRSPPSRRNHTGKRAEPVADRVRAFVKGLAQTGKIEGSDVMIEYPLSAWQRREYSRERDGAFRSAGAELLQL